jgi:DNA-binding MltR family transcriptional regulator
VAKELESGSARAAAVIGIAFLDDSLRDLLLKRMVKLNKEETEQLFSGPLGTFSTRIRICHAFGFIGPKTRHDLDTLRHVRNAMAHTPRETKFDTPEIHNLLRELCCIDYLKDRGQVEGQILFARATGTLLYFVGTRIRRRYPRGTDGYGPKGTGELV